MIEFTHTIEIQHPVETVFGFLSDFENIPKWNYFVVQVRKTSDGPVGLGSTFHQTRKSDEQSFAITEYEEGRRITVKTTRGSSPNFQRTFELEATDSGTRLIDTWQLELGANKLVETLGKARVKAAVADNLGKLKQLLETGHTRLQDGRSVSVS